MAVFIGRFHDGGRRVERAGRLLVDAEEASVREGTAPAPGLPRAGAQAAHSITLTALFTSTPSICCSEDALEQLALGVHRAQTTLESSSVDRNPIQR